ncbi:protein-lysine methyltransferase METTL21D-like [Chelonus insularis]|uniref:protein-lysine methyltransferase METTL21D-like n=1 Tax=Chelonus insularis TaxID=460826 RepID=UPI00158E6E8A|nr:protein-lysine methyltransferase METTL21D-like [Chelonus insularis]
MEHDDIFTRTLEIESCGKTLTLYQKNVGDVNCVVWDAALVLAKYLDISCQKEKNWLQGKKILELGAGVGCVGMTVACLGAQVMVTDLESTMPMLEKNIMMNKSQWKDTNGSVNAQIMKWEDESIFDSLKKFSPEIIILSDCIYYMESIDPLIMTLKRICDNESAAYVLLSQELRDTPRQISIWQYFLDNVKNYFHLNVISQSEQHPIYSSIDINLIKMTRRQ